MTEALRRAAHPSQQAYLERRAHYTHALEQAVERATELQRRAESAADDAVVQNVKVI